jgi:hypothetical protein
MIRNKIIKKCQANATKEVPGEKKRKRRREMWEKHQKIKEQKGGEIDVG